MKRKLITFGISLLLSLVVISCGKDGEIGPPGEKGEKGEMGEKGKDGNIILSGVIDPDIKTGKNGDFYLNLKTSYLFGPKTDTGWGKGFNLKGDKGDTGETGQEGENGSKIFSGNGVPDINLGSIGDYYIDKSNLNIYGPKASDWGFPVSLKSDAENKVRIFLFQPTFDQNLTNGTPNNLEYTFSANTKDYSIKSEKKLFMEFYTTILDPHENPDISFLNWQNLTQPASFNSVQITLDSYFKDFSITLYPSQKIQNGFYFKIVGIIKIYNMPPFTQLPLKNLTVLVKAIEFNEFEKVAKSHQDPKRYLRIKE